MKTSGSSMLAATPADSCPGTMGRDGATRHRVIEGHHVNLADLLDNCGSHRAVTFPSCPLLGHDDRPGQPYCKINNDGRESRRSSTVFQSGSPELRVKIRVTISQTSHPPRFAVGTRRITLRKHCRHQETSKWQ